MVGERLQKILSRAGVCSRRRAEVLIRQGRVAVNGQIVTELGSRARWGEDQITVDGRPIIPSEELVVYAFHKPSGCVTTMADPQGRRTVQHFIAHLPVRVYPVGRLDYDAEGLLLLTNDGALAHRLQHPRFKVPKTYHVKVKGKPDEEVLARLQNGVLLEDGKTAPAVVSVIGETKANTWLELTLQEGRYRQIKRMCARVGHPVMRLRRVAFGPVRLGGLKVGELRKLKTRERAVLRRLAGLD